MSDKPLHLIIRSQQMDIHKEQTSEADVVYMSWERLRRSGALYVVNGRRYQTVELQHPVDMPDLYLVRILRSIYRNLAPGGSAAIPFTNLVALMNGSVFWKDGYDYNVFNRDRERSWEDTEISRTWAVRGSETMVALMLNAGFENVVSFPGASGMNVDMLPLYTAHGVKPKGEQAGAETHAAIVSKGAPVSADRLAAYGYTWQTHWYPHQDDVAEKIRISAKLEQTYRDKYMNGRQELSDFENSLRQNWVCMLDSANPDTRLFLEGDATPNVYAAYLKEWCEKVLSEHPDTDVIKLFYRLSHHSVIPTGDHFAVFDARYPGKHAREQGREYVWGSHAYWVVNREKLLSVIRDNAMPVDTAVEMAAKEGLLKVRTANKDLFWQAPHSGTRQHMT